MSQDEKELWKEFATQQKRAADALEKISAQLAIVATAEFSIKGRLETLLMIENPNGEAERVRGHPEKPGMLPVMVGNTSDESKIHVEGLV